jgi:hypothetical protein
MVLKKRTENIKEGPIERKKNELRHGSNGKIFN